MAVSSVPIEVIKRTLDHDEPLLPVDAEGFPLDLALQRKARRVAVVHGCLALYYIAVMPFVLRYMRFDSLATIGEDLLLRANHIALIVGHLGANALLAVLAWHVSRLRAWVRWCVLAVSVCFTGWVLARIAWAVWGSIVAGHLSTEYAMLAVNCALFVAYVYCALGLMRSIFDIGVQRRRLIAEMEGPLRRE